MKRLLVQVYEIQDPEEAEAVAAQDVDHLGSVILSPEAWRLPVVRETVQTVQAAGKKSGIIPLFNDKETIEQVMAYYQPDFVHFCEALPPFPRARDITSRICENLLSLQGFVKDRFPKAMIMRSLSVPQAHVAQWDDVLDNILMSMRILAPCSDFFLIDTLRGDGDPISEQPVAGFVGITGETCDWNMSARLIAESQVPVILAGGLCAENVYDAIITTKPAGVDSCTRTNALGGDGRPVRFKKDLQKVTEWVAETRRAERALQI